MQSAQPSLIARDDTFLGVCEALGEDFGFNPIYLRIALAVPLIFNPVAVLAAYAVAGLIVALSRWLVPNRRSAAALQQADAGGIVQAEPSAEQDSPMDNDNADSDRLAVAA